MRSWAAETKTGKARFAGTNRCFTAVYETIIRRATMDKRTLKRSSIIFFAAILLTGLAAVPAQSATLDPAKLTQDLNSLVLQGDDLVATMTKITLTPITMSTQLTTLETSAAAYLANVGTVYKTVANAVGTSTFSVTNEMLVPLQTLATITASLGSGLLTLSQSTVTLAASTSFATLQSSMTAMLRLSDDIGMMADRILEMADKILIMADNIGLMADRILATQVIQSDNLKVVVDAVLQSQQNTILLIAMFNL